MLQLNKILKLYRSRIIMKDQTDINILLPKFYKKESQMSLKLNPLLKSLRQNNILSYRQLENKKLKQKQQKNCSFNNQKVKQKIFQRKFQNKYVLNTLNTNMNQQKNNCQNFNKTYFKYYQNNRNTTGFYRTTIQTAQNYANKEKRNYSYNYRSKTSNKQKKNNFSTLTPRTSDFQRNNLPIDFDKIHLNLLENPQSFLQNYDEDFCNYIRLKILTKMPYFAGGKFSKIKKHLVQEIDFEQIQKNFYKNPQTITKYKKFYDQILDKNKLSNQQLSKKVKKFNKNLNNRFFDSQKTAIDHDLKLKLDLNSRNFSQRIQHQNKLSELYSANQSELQFSSREKSRKFSLKARFWSKKELKKENIEQSDSFRHLRGKSFNESFNLRNQDQILKNIEKSLQINGQKKIMSPQRELKSKIFFIQKS